MPACALHSILRIACEITHFESGDVTQKKISKEHGLLYDKVSLPLTPKFTLYLQFSSPIFLQGAFITLPEDYQIVLILRSAIWEMIVLGKTTRERKYMAFINPWMQSFSLTREHQIIPDSFESTNFSHPCRILLVFSANVQISGSLLRNE